MDAAVAVSMAVFLLGVVYAAGRLSARVDAIEVWRTETAADLKVIRAVVEKVAGAVFQDVK